VTAHRPHTPTARALGEAAPRRGAQPPALTDGRVITAVTALIALLVGAHQFLP
jgi:hypothetical protein